jgi:hypothetical protein
VVMSASLAQATDTSAASMTAASGAPASSPSAASDITDQVAAWLGGSTDMFGYNVPNPLIVGVVVLGFALFTNMGSKRR